MNLVASLIVKDELDRYLLHSIDLLLGFCDSVYVYDDGSTDGTAEALAGMERVQVESAFMSRFYEHEGAARQRALDFAMMAHPTHILSIDGDELIGDGELLRARIEGKPDVAAWSLCMEEVWKCDPDGLMVRQDGGWKAHPVTIVFRPDAHGTQVTQQKLGGGRVPRGAGLDRRAAFSGVSILHMGWAREAERVARHARYTEHDGGQFHASAHLASIMWPDDRVRLQRCPWPAGTPDLTSAAVAAIANRP